MKETNRLGPRLSDGTLAHPAQGTGFCPQCGKTKLEPSLQFLSHGACIREGGHLCLPCLPCSFQLLQVSLHPVLSSRNTAQGTTGSPPAIPRLFVPQPFLPCLPLPLASDKTHISVPTCPPSQVPCCPSSFQSIDSTRGAAVCSLSRLLPLFVIH